MVVEKELPIAGRYPGRNSSCCGAIARSQTGVHDKRRTAANHYPYVRPAHNGPNVVRDLGCVVPEYWLVLRKEGGSEQCDRI